MWFVYLWHPTLALFKLQIHLFPSLSFRLGNSFHTQTHRQTDKSTISYKYKRLSRLNNSFSTCNCSSLPSCTLTPTQPTYNQNQPQPQPATMSSRSPYGKVQVHQEDDINSSYSYSSDPYSSSGSSSRSHSSSSGNYRAYGASESHQVNASSQTPPLTLASAKHTSGVRRSGQNLVIQHNAVGYTHGDPSPGYVGGYSRTN